MKKTRVHTGRALFGMMAPENLALIQAAEKDHGQPFLKVLEGYAQDGMSREATARILGFKASTFISLLEKIDPGIAWKKKGNADSIKAIMAAKWPEAGDYKSQFWRGVRAGLRQGHSLSELSRSTNTPLSTVYRRLRAHPDAIKEHHDAAE